MNITELTQEQKDEILQYMNEINEALGADENEKALLLAEELSELSDNILDALPDDMPIDLDFENLFQQIVYDYQQNRKRRHVRPILPMCRILLMHGVALLKLERYEEAQPLLERAMGWNPVSTKAAFAYVECCKALDDRSEFWVTTKDILSFATETQELARCYRNLGWYLTECGDYEAAKACYLFSLTWEQEPQVQQELEYIDQKAGKHIEDPDIEMLKAAADKYNFQLGPDHDVVGLAYNYGKEMLAQREYDAAKYFLGIAYGLVRDEGIKQLLDQAERESQEAQQV